MLLTSSKLLKLDVITCLKGYFLKCFLGVGVGAERDLCLFEINCGITLMKRHQRGKTLASNSQVKQDVKMSPVPPHRSVLDIPSFVPVPLRSVCLLLLALFCHSCLLLLHFLWEYDIFSLLMTTRQTVDSGDSASRKTKYKDNSEEFRGINPRLHWGFDFCLPLILGSLGTQTYISDFHWLLNECTSLFLYQQCS